MVITPGAADLPNLYSFGLSLVGTCGTNSYTVDVVVLANQPPVFVGGFAQPAVDAYFGYPEVISLPSTSDPEGDHITMSVVDDATGVALSFMTFRPSSITVLYDGIVD